MRTARFAPPFIPKRSRNRSWRSIYVTSRDLGFARDDRIISSSTINPQTSHPWPNKKTPSDVSKMIKDHEVKLVDFKFTDLPGAWQHFTTTLTEYNEEIFTEGLGFDGSSIRGWKVINASDMLVIPDPATAWIDIFNAEPTLSLICTIVEPITREPYNRDPRGVAEKAEAYLQSTGIADTAFFGPEAEFFIFDDVRFSNTGNCSFYRSTAQKGIGTARAKNFPNLGYKIRAKEGYFPVAPADTLAGYPQRNVSGTGESRHPDRAPASRSRDRGPGRDRYSFRPDQDDGRLHAVLQIHRAQRRAEAQQDGHVHAEAALRR